MKTKEQIEDAISRLEKEIDLSNQREYRNQCRLVISWLKWVLDKESDK